MIKLQKGQLQWLRRAFEREEEPEMRQRIRMVLLRESGMTQPEIARETGRSLSTVNRAHMAYNRGGLKALRPNPCGGRINQNMSVEEEKALLARFAQAAEAGQVLNIRDLKEAYDKEIGHATSTSTIYKLLHRHGWRKHTSRPYRPVSASTWRPGPPALPGPGATEPFVEPPQLAPDPLQPSYS